MTHSGHRGLIAPSPPIAGLVSREYTLSVSEVVRETPPRLSSAKGVGANVLNKKSVGRSGRLDRSERNGGSGRDQGWHRPNLRSNSQGLP